MRYGFSTGALARGDFSEALRMMEGLELQTVEVSALRLGEFDSVLEAVRRGDFARFETLSLHAPSKFDAAEERWIATALESVGDMIEGAVVHAEAILDTNVWSNLGSKVFIENADSRKATGKTLDEIEPLFEALPEARLCFDIAHIEQLDPTLTEARRMLGALGEKIGQMHISELDAACRHRAMSPRVISAYQTIADLLPPTEVIIESCVGRGALKEELERAILALNPQELIDAAE